MTYVWNGNRSGFIDESLETYIEIPSDNAEFGTTPAMTVPEITEETFDLMRSGAYRFGRLNFPSGDIVGHIGHLHATVAAMEVIDSCMADLLKVIDDLGGVLTYTADHGNADIMFTETNGVPSPRRPRTLSPVPFAIYDPNHGGDYHMVSGCPVPRSRPRERRSYRLESAWLRSPREPPREPDRLLALQVRGHSQSGPK
ncbi:MAG: hypothetical protein P8O03_00105 [Ilumatobacter sp.]|nr:hypothetical protein [Ilumatobacter sp.]MDG1695985.1 hypothetical protein [Ilumatobacter sp.]